MRRHCAVPYEYAQWKKARVNIDYHVEVFRHYYSVPYQLRGEEVDVRIAAKPSKSSSVAVASPRTRVIMCVVDTRRSRRTCRVHIASISNGVPHA